MLSPNVIAHITATHIPPIAWRRAGLLGEPRACLGDCTPGELYALCAIQATTPEGRAFTRYAGTMVAILEDQHDAHALAGDADDRAWVRAAGHDGTEVFGPAAVEDAA
jgi:hypothetical protein